MNIFMLDKDIEKCAEYHVDRHVIKMRLELNQLACAAHHLNGTNQKSIPYKLTHQNHPCSIWVMESIQNYRFAVNLSIELCNEMIHRFGTKTQKSLEVALWLKENEPNIPDLGLTVMKPSIPLELIKNNNGNMQQTIENYRNYYSKGKVHLHKWTNRNKPNWI